MIVQVTSTKSASGHSSKVVERLCRRQVAGSCHSIVQWGLRSCPSRRISVTASTYRAFGRGGIMFTKLGCPRAALARWGRGPGVSLARAVGTYIYPPKIRPFVRSKNDVLMVINLLYVPKKFNNEFWKFIPPKEKNYGYAPASSRITHDLRKMVF